MSAAAMTQCASFVQSSSNLVRRPAASRQTTSAFLVGPAFGGRAFRRPRQSQPNAACRPAYRANWGGAMNGQPMTLQQLMQAWEKAAGSSGFGQSPSWQEAVNSLSLPVDMIEGDQEYIFVADIPGLAKEDLKVRVNKDRQLTISGERKRPQQQMPDASSSDSDNKEATSAQRRQRLERHFGAFSRTIPLPRDADTGSISAKVTRGVLTLTVKKLDNDPDVTEIPIY